MSRIGWRRTSATCLVPRREARGGRGGRLPRPQKQPPQCGRRL